MKKYLKVFKGVKIPWLLIAIILTASVVEGNITIGQTTLTADIIDSASSTISLKMLTRYMFYMALLVGVGMIRSWLGEIAYGKVNERVRNKAFAHFLKLPLKFYDTTDSNEMVSRITNDCASGSSYFEVVINTFSAIYTAVLVFWELITSNEQLGLYSLLIIPVSLAVAGAYGYLTFRASARGVNYAAGTTGYLFERVSAFKMIKAFNTQAVEKLQGNRMFKRMFRADLLAEMSITFALFGMQIVSITGIIIAFVFGGRMVQEGTLTLGGLIKFYSLSGVVGIQLINLFLSYGGFTSINGAMKKVAELLELEEEKTDGSDVDPEDQDIHFENVSFAYGDVNVLNDVNMTIEKNKITAIIGTNGAGKSTVFKLLERTYEPTEGKITFGDEDIAGYDLHQYRDLFAIVSQNAPLVSGTIRENMCYGCSEEVTEEKLIETAKAAGIYEYILSQENGFDSPIAIGGTNVSGGQRQQIAIARAILKNSRYLLLDEATKSLDAASEKVVKEALNRLMKGRTTIMIAHNPSAIVHADKIIVMKDGRVDDVGTQKELAERNAYYQVFAGGKG